MIDAVTATATSRNGHRTTPISEEEPQPQSLPGRLIRALADQVTRRVPLADLDERDPDYIREALPGMWLLSSLWFRGEVRGLGNIPEDGPVLLVGNHSGGNMSPDNAEKALRSGAAVLVYPGGDHEVHRPSWHSGRVEFAGRKGFIRLALDHDVPIVPVVSIGGQETALFLSRGESLSRLLGLDRLLRLKVLPVSLALPWGVNVGDFLGHIPLPAKITIEALPPIRLREEFGPDPDVDEAYAHVTRAMQETLDALAA